jgi:hypothetical protein
MVSEFFQESALLNRYTDLLDNYRDWSDLSQGYLFQLAAAQLQEPEN